MPLVLVGLAAPRANAVQNYFQFQIWMMPPVANLGSQACLSQAWHSSDPAFDYMRALDWKTTCGASGSESVRLRVLGAEINVPYNGTNWAPMYGVAADLALGDCPGKVAWQDSVHLGRVRLYGIDVISRGFMIFAHTDMNVTGNIPVNVTRGATRSTAYLTSSPIGNTVNDGVDIDHDGDKDFTDCWQGWHTHENNSDDATMYWDKWNTTHYSGHSGDYYTNNNDDNYSRRMSWDLYAE
jgi:hypothetical protein